MHQIESSEEQTPKWDYIRDMQEISWGNTLWEEKGKKPVGGGENCQITVQCERGKEELVRKRLRLQQSYKKFGAGLSIPMLSYWLWTTSEKVW